MGNAIRWTPEDLAAYQAKSEKASMPGVDIDAVHRKQGPSKLELRFEQQMNEGGIWPAKEDEPAGYFRQFYFLKGRDLTIDFAWPGFMIGVEVQGMAHRIKGKFKTDIEKRALAMLRGWRVLEVDGASIRDGRAIGWLRSLLWEKMP